MTRTFAIAKRILTELLHDKRTLAMIFIAPMLILTLMNYVFNITSSTSVDIATVHVEQQMDQGLAKTKNVNVKHYDSKEAADSALKDQKVDAVLSQTSDGNYDIFYANTDSSKTAATRKILANVFTQNKLSGLSQQVATLSQRVGVQPNLGSNFNLNESYSYGDKDTTFFASIMPIFMGFFVFLFVFLISGVSLLKERTKGTLSRLLATPVRRSEIIYGYMLSYSVIAILQTAIIVFFTISVLNVEVLGSVWNLLLINILLALVALALGLLVSTLASSEFQMIQFIPVVVVPQLIFSGIIPLNTMADWAQVIGDCLPMKYASNAMTEVVLHGQGFGQIWTDLLALFIFLVLLTAGNIFGLRRYRKV
ncbi:ABC transporter permease [Leuconostocaceae bacterium ESL0958]|nr:ABC transporter permease [Leuconostocaceae bacterium ESL0958]